MKHKEYREIIAPYQQYVVEPNIIKLGNWYMSFYRGKVYAIDTLTRNFTDGIVIKSFDNDWILYMIRNIPMTR